MNAKIGRNDACPCGSGKKYKQCCLSKPVSTAAKKKFTAKLLSQPKAIDLMERTFGSAIESISKEEKKTPPETEESEKEQSSAENS